MHLKGKINIKKAHNFKNLAFYEKCDIINNR